ncbi:MAG: Hpt domain-containing protein [Vicinamibacterales bacterium]
MSEPVIDSARTAAFGDPETEPGRSALIEIFRVYFDNVSAACAQMRRAASSEEVRAHAHRAKGASGVVGAVALTAAFADIESRAAAGEDVPADVFDDVDRDVEALRRLLATRIGEEFQ